MSLWSSSLCILPVGTFRTNFGLKYEFCVVNTLNERVQFFCVREVRAGEDSSVGK